MTIDHYRFGKITIEGKDYTRDVIIYSDRVQGDWWRRQGHELHPDDLSGVLEARPEVLVVGRGSYGMMRVPKETEAMLREAEIEVIAEKTARACEIFNELVIGERKVVAALHLTC